MSTVIEQKPAEKPEEKVPTDGLFWVWFDTNFGNGLPEWWWELPGAQPLMQALSLSAKMRADGWIVRVMPDGMNPRTDGRWDNPI